MAQVIDIKVSKENARRMVVANIKQEHGENTIVLFVDDEIYTGYDKDAEVIANSCGLTFNNTGCKDNVTLTDIRITKDMEFYVFPRMVKQGYKICVIE